MYGNEPFNKSDLVWNYFHEHPSEEVTPKKLAQKLDIKYNTANSAINRLYISGKIKKKMCCSRHCQKDRQLWMKYSEKI